MATKFSVGGKLITRPGVYAFIKSGISNAPAGLDYGHVVIVDDGIGANWGGGKGGSSYQFSDIQTFQAFVKGGELWNIGAALFLPYQNNPGASKVTLVHARVTTPARIEFIMTNGTLKLTTKDEGLNANGFEDSNNVLRTGYAATLETTSDSKFVLKIFHGSFRSIDALNNAPYDNIQSINAAPTLITQSTPVTSLNELHAWATSALEVLTGFTIEITGGQITNGDVSTNAGNVLAVGGTESYTPTAFQAALDLVKPLNANFFLATSGGVNAISNNNTSLVALADSTKYKSFVAIAGGSSRVEYANISKPAALHYNSETVIVVHGDALKTIRGGYKRVSSLWKTANLVGRLAGLPPQTPVTYKALSIDAEFEELTESQLSASLSDGVLVSYFDDELGIVVVQQGVNTLQANSYLINDDGSTSSVQLARVKAQLNKELAIYLKKKFFANQTVGPNRGTVSEQDLIAATDAFLESRHASTQQDNYILRHGNVTCYYDQDAAFVNYEFVANFEVNKIIITGIIVAS